MLFTPAQAVRLITCSAMSEIARQTATLWSLEVRPRPQQCLCTRNVLESWLHIHNGLLRSTLRSPERGHPHKFDLDIQVASGEVDRSWLKVIPMTLFILHCFKWTINTARIVFSWFYIIFIHLEAVFLPVSLLLVLCLLLPGRVGLDPTNWDTH